MKLRFPRIILVIACVFMSIECFAQDLSKPSKKWTKRLLPTLADGVGVHFHEVRVARPFLPLNGAADDIAQTMSSSAQGELQSSKRAAHLSKPGR